MMFVASFFCCADGGGAVFAVAVIEKLNRILEEPGYLLEDRILLFEHWWPLLEQVGRSIRKSLPGTPG